MSVCSNPFFIGKIPSFFQLKKKGSTRAGKKVSTFFWRAKAWDVRVHVRHSRFKKMQQAISKTFFSAVNLHGALR
jgi:hypothetical protein